jgi:AbrB family transcriptional regulator (stage V sporulation protein T)
MKTTGIVRRIDELGRVVIPKEIRRTMRLRDGEELEISLGNNDDLILKKFSPVKRIKDFSEEYCRVLAETTGNNVIVCDMDEAIAAAGDKKGDYAGRTITPRFEREMSARKAVILLGADIISVVGEETDDAKAQIIAPILSRGDVFGAVVMTSNKYKFDESDLKICKAAALFLSYQA